jgi:hypothetical protein
VTGWLLGEQQPEQDEREHPREIEVEPVGQGELEGDEHGGGQRRQLDRSLSSRQHRDEQREHDGADDQHRLDEP